jgi:hypothetical protein
MTDLTGWVLVPRVADEAMVNAAAMVVANFGCESEVPSPWDESSEDTREGLREICRAQLDATIAASPSPPVDVAGLVGERDRLAEEHAWLTGKLRDSERDNDERIRRYTDNLNAEVRMWREQHNAIVQIVAKGMAFMPPAPISMDSALIARAEAAEAECARLREALAAVASLIDESDGVAGLHRNGDIATWGELRTGGRFEEWLAPFDAALTHQDPTK